MGNITENFEIRKSKFLEGSEKIQNWLKENGYTEDAGKFKKFVDNYLETQEYLNNMKERYFPIHSRQALIITPAFKEIVAQLENCQDKKALREEIMDIDGLNKQIDLINSRRIPFRHEDSPPKKPKEALADFRRMYVAILTYLEKEGLKHIAQKFEESANKLETAMHSYYNAVSEPKWDKSVTLRNLSNGKNLAGGVFFRLTENDNKVINEETRKANIVRIIQQECETFEKLTKDCKRHTKSGPRSR